MSRVGFERMYSLFDATTITKALNITMDGQATTDDDSNNKSSKISTPKLVNWKLFRSLDWDDYLKHCKGEPAPIECFNHNVETPSNEFELNQKLEVTSQDNRDFMHLATVVGLIGPRLQLRLDGCDNSNDIFELVDSESIHPIGTNDHTKNRYLAAPLRFRKDAAAYQSFCQQVLKNSIKAPEKCFKTPPRKPLKNLFKPGMKLEAVDIKHPYNICPATIQSVDNSRVEVHLDGWDHTNNYKCPFTSRNLFPCGWCKKTGMILQFPGPKADYTANSDKKPQDASINVTQNNPSIPDENAIKNNHVNNQTKNASNNNKHKSTNNSMKSNTTKNNQSSHSLPVDDVSLNKSAHITEKSNKKISSTPKSDSLISKKLVNNSDNDNKNHVVESSSIVIRGSKRINSDQTDKAEKRRASDNDSNSAKNLMNGKKSSLIEQYEKVLPTKDEVNKWSTDELIEFLNLRFPELNKYESFFRSQEIDGESFLMLSHELLMKFSQIKLGYSLKLVDLIKKINSETC